MEITESRHVLPVKGATEMPVYAARPGRGATAGLLVFQEAFGVNGHIRSIVRRLAEAGYWAAAPELFHRTAPPGFEGGYGDFTALRPHMDALTSEALTADLEAVHAWAADELKSDQLGCVGFCMGGSTSYLANARLPLKAAVSFYGTRILQQDPAMAAAQRAPLLLIWGGKDKGTPPEKIGAVTDALRAAGKDFVNVEFAQAEHGFNCDERPSYLPAAAAEAWDLTLSFFRRHLAPPAP